MLLCDKKLIQSRNRPFKDRYAPMEGVLQAVSLVQEDSVSYRNFHYMLYFVSLPCRYQLSVAIR